MIGEKIKQIRKSNHMTQSEFGLLLGVRGAAVSKYETGIVIPTYEQVSKIASVFNIPIEELMDSDIQVPLFDKYVTDQYDILEPILPPYLKNVGELKVNLDELTQMFDNYACIDVTESQRQQIKHVLLAVAENSNLLSNGVQLLEKAELYRTNRRCKIAFDKLNLNGKNKVFDYMQDLLKIADYRNTN